MVLKLEYALELTEAQKTAFEQLIISDSVGSENFTLRNTDLEE